MIFKGIAAASLAICLTACSGGEAGISGDKSTAPSTASKPAEAAEQEKQIQEKVAATHDSIEKAMSEIPPELREKHTAAFNCMIEKNNESATPVAIDASIIRSITAKLKAGESGTC